MFKLLIELPLDIFAQTGKCCCFKCLGPLNVQGLDLKVTLSLMSINIILELLLLLFGVLRSLILYSFNLLCGFSFKFFGSFSD